MKKAFDANVSRARPRVRLSAALGEAAVETDVPGIAVEAIAAAIASEPPVKPALSAVEGLASALKERTQALHEPRPTAVEAVQAALATVVEVHAPPPPPVAAMRAAPEPLPAPRMHAEAPPPVIEVQSPPRPPREDELEPDRRRERLKERLKAVRENPKPEPLPETVAEAGVLAVERISALQTELTKVRALNLAVTQDLEGARRQAERATEEARLRVDEAKRLSGEMEGRVKLLSELERELSALEGERDEALLALQEAKASIDAQERDKDTLKAEIQKRDQALAESLSEEERLAAELEESHEASSSLRKTCDALRSERDTLARQVSELTRERADLLEARKALQAVHRALTQAVAR
jgi:DNA repair exonuclease SbcCD ATPase subunit